tara:strand:+ start:105 stop:353 length:249 start_codon:yes stop_codon:yes gene_type:complete
MDKLNSLISKINSLNLNTEQYVEIYKIVRKGNVKIMKNNNGAFINLSNVENNTIKELEDLVSYIDSQDLIEQDLIEQDLMEQ